MGTRRKPVSFLQKTMKELRKQGWTGDITERMIPGRFMRKDFCGFSDAIVFRVGHPGVHAVQVCSESKIEEHLAKYRKWPLRDKIATFLQCGNTFSLYAWGKRNYLKKNGSRKTWKFRVIPYQSC